MRRTVLVVLAAALDATAAPPKIDAPDPLPRGAVSRYGVPRLRHAGDVSAVALTADGTLVATASVDGTVRLWDGATGRELGRTAGPDAARAAVAFGPGTTLLFVDRDDALAAWDWKENTRRILYKPKDSGLHAAVAVGPGRATAAVVPHGSGPVRLDLATGSAEAPLARPIAEVEERRRRRRGDGIGETAIALSADGKRAALCVAPEAVVRVWDLRTGKRIRTHDCGAAAGPVAFGPDGRTIFALAEGRLLAFDPDSEEPLDGYAAPTPSLSAFAFALDGKAVVAAGTDGRVYRFDARTGKDLAAVGDGLGDKDEGSGSGRSRRGAATRPSSSGRKSSCST